MVDTSKAQYQLSTGARNYIFILLFLLYFFDYTDRMVVSSLLPFIQKDWGINDQEGALLLSAVSWAILVFTFPISILVDRWSRRKTVGLMAIFWSLATAACALMPNFKALFSTRALIGVGEAGYAPGGTAILSGLYPEDKRARMMGIWNASIPLGSALGIALGGVIATYLGWRHAFGLVAIPGFIVAILFFFIKDYKTVELKSSTAGAVNDSGKSRMSVAEIAGKIARTPTLYFTYFGFAMMVFVTASMMMFLPTFFARVSGVAPAQAGLMASAVMVLAVIGAPLGGYLADLWLKKRKNARLLFCSISAIVSAVLLFISMYLTSGTAQYIVLLLLGISITSFIPGVSAAMQDIVHPGLRAITFAIAIIIQHLLGTALGPIVTGTISDAYGIQAAFMILPAFLFAAAVIFFIGSFFFNKDYDRVERVELVMEK
ncbi:MAG: MFS transporter [Chloroflexi bacterium]|nr:MFS transporter [Chloroflexota bacterium]